MRIKDKVANRIIEYFEEHHNLKISKEEYLDVECQIADLIQAEIKAWLCYDVDLQKRDVLFILIFFISALISKFLILSKTSYANGTDGYVYLI